MFMVKRGTRTTTLKINGPLVFSLLFNNKKVEQRTGIPEAKGLNPPSNQKFSECFWISFWEVFVVISQVYSMSCIKKICYSI